MPHRAQVHVLPSGHDDDLCQHLHAARARAILLHTGAADQRRRYSRRDLRTPDIALLGPIANEITGDVPAVFAESTVIAAVPQGWMRRLDERGRVHSKQWESAREILPHLDALILSLEDVDYEWERLAPAFNVPLIIVTEYRDGSTVFERQADGSIHETKIPPRPAHEVDPTGAGDIFTTAFLIRLEETRDPMQAARFGNVAASMSVEHVGATGIPTREAILSYMDTHPFEPEPVEQSKF
jgi:1D-myo-inositol 3-kinase